MVSPLNAFFSCPYASATIAKLFAPLSWHSARAPGGQNGSLFGKLLAREHFASAKSPDSTADLTGHRTQMAVRAASIIIVPPSPTVHDLAIEEMILTGNNASAAPPATGSSNFVDALMQLAKGADMALAVAARNLLPRLGSSGGYGADGQPIITYKHDPLSGPVTLESLGDVAGYWAGNWWSDGAIAKVASAMANGQQPDQAAVNFLRAGIFGAVFETAVEAVSGGDGKNQCSSFMAASFFDRQVSRDPAGKLTSLYETVTYGNYMEF